jgi:uncharacterized protein YggE
MRAWMLVAALLMSTGWGPAGSAAGTACEKTPSVTVTGAGKTSARPDTAEVTVGVTSEAASASEALRANNQAMKQLFGVLSRHKLADKDIQTVTFGVAPRYEYDHPGGRGRLVGYQVTNQTRVTVRQIEGLGALLDDLVGGGANTVSAVVFSVSEPAALQDAARRKAMEDARRKAALYARAAGLTLGPVTRVDERVGGPRPFQAQIMMSRTEPAVPVAEGELEFRADVTVTFALEGTRK